MAAAISLSSRSCREESPSRKPGHVVVLIGGVSRSVEGREFVPPQPVQGERIQFVGGGHGDASLRRFSPHQIR